MVGTKNTISVTCRVMFGHTIMEKGKPVECAVLLAADGSDSVEIVKEKIAAAFGGKVKKDQLLLYFGPNERRVGKQFSGDPSVDEAALKLSQFFILPWLQRFPQWRLGVRLMPPAPPAPGVAIFRAAAMAEGKDPDMAVQDARIKGEIPTLLELPAPWGPKAYVPTSADAAHSPAHFPGDFSPVEDYMRQILAA